MYSQTIGAGFWRAPAGSHSRALKRMPSFRVIHSLSTTSTPVFCGSRQRFVAVPVACAAPKVRAAGIADNSSDERSKSRRDMLIGIGILCEALFHGAD